MLNRKETVIWTLQAFVCVHVRAREKRGRNLKEEREKKGSLNESLVMGRQG